MKYFKIESIKGFPLQIITREQELKSVFNMMVDTSEAPFWKMTKTMMQNKKSLEVNNG